MYFITHANRKIYADLFTYPAGRVGAHIFLYAQYQHKKSFFNSSKSVRFVIQIILEIYFLLLFVFFVTIIGYC